MASPSAEIVQFPCLSDNYGFLLHDPASGETAAIDTPDAAAYQAELEKRGWRLTAILNTHHHFDHAGGNLALKEAYNCRIYGPAGEQDRIPGLDVALKEGESLTLGEIKGEVIEVPGHTAGHIAYYFAGEEVLFAGDALFALGCGRLFEGTPEQMHNSLSKLARLPDATRVFCAHEYSEANLRFALSLTPNHPPLLREAERITGLRAKNLPTVPSSIGAEKTANPFLRFADPEFAAALEMTGEAEAQIFAKTRRLKDEF